MIRWSDVALVLVGTVGAFLLGLVALWLSDVGGWWRFLAAVALVLPVLHRIWPSLWDL